MKQNKIDRIMKYYNIFTYLYMRITYSGKPATLLSVYEYSIACAEKDGTGSSA